MGVPLLLTWLRRYFSHCFRRPDAIGPQDHLYVDLNSLLYPAVNIAADALLQRLAAAEVSTGGHSGASSLLQRHHASSSSVSVKEAEDAILSALVSLLEKLCVICPPQRLLYIASDGVSPMGKMSHQRARRQNSTARSAARRLCDVTGFDITMLTCGSAFMERVTHATHYFATMYVERTNSKRHAFNCKIASGTVGGEQKQQPLLTAIVVDATTPGEGEHKIFEAIRAFRSFASYDHNVKHCVCSSDTDVIVSSLTLHEPLMYALRFDPSGPHEPAAFSIEAFRQALYERLQPRSSDEFEMALHDFVFVLLLFGNDFLPRIADVADIAEGALDAFIKFLADNFVSRGKRLVNECTGEVYVDAAVYLFDFLEELPASTKAARGGGLTIEFGESGTDVNEWDQNKNEGSAEAEVEVIRKRCYAYWTMLQWAMQYCCGPVPMWNVAYPFSTVPSIAQLRNYCGMDLETVRVQGVANEPLDVLAQLLILTPPHSVQRVLPPALRYLDTAGNAADPSCADIASVLSRPFEDIPLEAITSWCASRAPRLTHEEQRRREGYIRGGVPTALYWEPEIVNQELLAAAGDSNVKPAASSSSTAVRAMPPFFNRTISQSSKPSSGGGGFTFGFHAKQAGPLSSVLPGLNGPTPPTNISVESQLPPQEEDTADRLSKSSESTVRADIKAGGLLSTPTFTFEYNVLPDGAALSTVEGATFTLLSPFSSTSEKILLSRGAHHRKVFLRFVSCGTAGCAGTPAALTVCRDADAAQTCASWKPLPGCKGTLTTVCDEVMDAEKKAAQPEGGIGIGQKREREEEDSSSSTTLSSAGEACVAPLRCNPTVDQKAHQRAEMLRRRQQAQRELVEAREAVKVQQQLHSALHPSPSQ